MAPLISSCPTNGFRDEAGKSFRDCETGMVKILYDTLDIHQS